MINRWFTKKTLVVLALIGVVASPPVLWAQEDDKPVSTYKLLNLFGNVFEQVLANYVEEPDPQEMIEAAIHGMLSSLDPHSSYLTAKSFEDMRVQTRGEFGGLGIEVTMDKGVIKVVSPIDDTPAHRAGVKSGDLITHLDGTPVLGLTLNEAVDKMRGKVGADIVVTIYREGMDPFDVTITRAVIKIKSVRSKLHGNIGYVRITTFNEQATKGLIDAMSDFRKELGDDLEGVVLDLRNNPGGLLDQAISVSDAFLEQGEIVSTRSRDPEKSQRFNARKGEQVKGLPVIVLINGGSASASEIVAGALQDHDRAIILGTQTFGKGSVQTIRPLGEFGAMRLTTSRYYTPSGNSIQNVGITPDIVVPEAKIEILSKAPSRREADLRGTLSNDAKPEEEDTDGVDNGDVEDYQLSRALDLLHGLNLYRSANGG